MHAFDLAVPLSTAEFERLSQFAQANSVEVNMLTVPGLGTFVAVISGNWRLIKQELIRMGRKIGQAHPYVIGTRQDGFNRFNQ